MQDWSKEKAMGTDEMGNNGAHTSCEAHFGVPFKWFGSFLIILNWFWVTLPKISSIEF